MQGECLPRLTAIGISCQDAVQLRRVAMTLHRWHELECGSENGAIERDEETGRPFWHHQSRDGMSERKMWVKDREAGAKRRLAKIMGNYPGFTAYVQGDPRGASLYILRPGDVPEGKEADAYYSRGVAVYK